MSDSEEDTYDFSDSESEFEEYELFDEDVDFMLFELRKRAQSMVKSANSANIQLHIQHQES